MPKLTDTQALYTPAPSGNLVRVTGLFVDQAMADEHIEKNPNDYVVGDFAGMLWTATKDSQEYNLIDEDEEIDGGNIDEGKDADADRDEYEGKFR